MNKFIFFLLLTLFSGYLLATTPIASEQITDKMANITVKKYLKKMATKEILVDGEKSSIIIGRNAAKLANEDIDKMPMDSWKIITKDNKILLFGGGSRGSLYAVWNFLQKYCKVRYWNSFNIDTPNCPKLLLSKINDSGKAFFGYRHIYRKKLKQNFGEMAIAFGLNNEDTNAIGTQWGGSVGFGPPRFVHTMWSYVPVEKYFKTNPEYYALVNGVRRGGRESQLCFSNPNLPKIIFEQLKNYISQGEKYCSQKKLPYREFYDISINDNSNFCQCEKCKENIKKYGISGNLLLLLNPVADMLDKYRPNYKITTLAYLEASNPPKNIAPRKNIIIRLCSELNMAASIYEKDNDEFRNKVEQWGKIHDDIFIWDYAVTYIQGSSGMPFASELYYSDRYKFYAKNNIKGIMWEHPFEPNADMFELKLYLECKLMDNPYLDVEKLTKDFLKDYYGDAGTYIFEARKLLDASRKKHKAVIKFMSPASAFQFHSEKDIQNMQNIYDKAENAVKDNSKLLQRVRRARRGLDRLTCSMAKRPWDNGKKAKISDKNLIQSALNRLQESWVLDLKDYSSDKKLKPLAEFEISKYNVALNENPKTIPQFADKTFYDFSVSDLQIFMPNAIQIVKDPESSTGFAIEVNANKSDYFKPPFVMGFRNRVAKTTVQEKIQCNNMPKIYKWYKLGTFTLPKRADVFFTRAWSIKLHLSNMNEKRPLEFWASIKFTGKMFGQKDEEKNSIKIDRIIAIPKN